MRLLSVFISRLRAAVSSSPGDDQEFDEEIRSHIDLLTDRYRREGLTATEAKAAARRQFGRTTRLKEHVHDQGTILWLETILQDVRYSLRYLQKSPLFCFTAVFTLALGIGVNTAVFSIFYAVLLRPLPFKNADQLTMIWEQNQHRGWDHNIVSAANFNDWNRQNHVFTGMALIDPFITFNLSGSEAPVVVRAERVTPNLFSLLGVQPFIGRSFLPEEGRPGSRAVILGYSLWKGRYASDPSIVGKQLSLNNENYTVIGVLPAGFDGEFMRESEGAEVWVAGLDLSDPGRNDHNFIAIARLRDGITLQKAQAEMTALAARLQQQYPEDKDWSVGLVSLHDELVGNSRPALLILLVGVSLVLLIACTNLANVLLARGMARLREFAVRQALGATRGRLLGQLLTESLVISVLGAFAGLCVAGLATKGLIAIAPTNTPGIQAATVHGPIVLYVAAIACFTTILFGLAPDVTISKLHLSNGLKESSRSITGPAGAANVRKILVISELSITLVLAVGAGLMVKTLLLMHHIQLGFQPDHVLALRVPLSDVKYRPNQQTEFYTRLLARLTSLPAIESASISRGIPFFGWAGQGFVTGDNPNPPLSEMPDCNVLAVGPQYFQVLRIPLKKGRLFTAHDTDDAQRVAIVNEALARKEWPNQDPIGKRVKVAWTNALWLTVIGVTGNVRTDGPEANFLPEIYTAYTQHPWYLTPRDLLIRTKNSNPLVVLPEIRRLIRELDPNQPIADVRTLEGVTAQPLAVRNFLTYLLGGFAFLGLLLAAIGVYGVMAYAVAQRWREMGIRIALGANRRQMLNLILSDGFRLGISGIVIGTVGSIAATRLLRSQLYGVKSTDPWVFGIVAVLLAAVAILAAYIPAYHASRVDPITVLREE